MSPRPGEVWLANLGLAAKTRPVVIVSRHDPAAPRSLALYVPLTTQPRGSNYEVSLPRLGFLRETSTANVQGLASLTVIRLEGNCAFLAARCSARSGSTIEGNQREVIGKLTASRQASQRL